ncbi:gem-associated 8 [Labeo rohita]|uniref:Gem-associated protein 8 n=2 Tax=Labeo rohita TaxID=84645 RepID=A0ABQ8N1E1_LABRO|nr:gem-associated protein 8 [Labeo rohita]XP_050975968.1 gem-associated protein 8 [Labeo rohita]XP_050975979.1 gem-associated protein 8 [Labeo rohita]KAI2668472.1 Gem-associated protein 8 [Labeo rohita]RXN02856.1 gem-associated 8 [Labeo rohita]
MASQGDGEVWYAHPVYARYWQHYQQAMSWYQRHKRAYRKALEFGYFQAMYSTYPSPIQRYSDWHADESWRDGHRDRTTGREEARDNEATDSDSEKEESSDESQIECDVSNMDISEELRQYFAQTERHKQELKKQQQMEAEQHDLYVLADQDLHRVSWRSSLPPSERPGERRTAEMKKLYGKDAAKIQGMEAAMQLTFDRNCDKKQPKYWPVIPLNL